MSNQNGRIESYKVQARVNDHVEWYAAGGTWSNVDQAVDAAHEYAERYPDREVRVVRTVAYAEQVAIIRPAVTK